MPVRLELKQLPAGYRYPMVFNFQVINIQFPVYYL
jgi:hypothetical protein